MPNVTAAISACWDSAAASFDDQVDHGLRQHPARAAWAHRMRSWMPTVPADVMDLGSGTGSLTLLVAEHGHRPRRHRPVSSHGQANPSNDDLRQRVAVLRDGILQQIDTLTTLF